MNKSGNQNHPKKFDRITVDPIRRPKDIKAISKLTQDNPRDHLLFIMGVNNGLRVCDLIRVKVKDVMGLKVGDALTIKNQKQARTISCL